MLNCHDARGLIVRTIDDPGLPGDARAALRLHLAGCGNCREEYETQHEVRRLLALHIEDPLPTGFTERLNVRLAQERLRAAHAIEAVGAVGAVEGIEAVEPIETIEGIQAIAPAAPAVAASASAVAAVAVEVAVPAAVASGRGAVAHASLFAEAPQAAPSALAFCDAQAPAPRASRWRVGLGLLPIAATIALVVADAQLRHLMPQSPSSLKQPASAQPSTGPAYEPPGSPLAIEWSPSVGGAQPSPSGSASQSTSTTASQSSPSSSLQASQGKRSTTTAAAAATNVTNIAAHAAGASTRPLTNVAPQNDAITETATVATTAAPAPATTSATSPVSAEHVAPLAEMPIVYAPDLAEALKLSDTQRKQIDKAIERVLTPDQRRVYRERQSNPVRSGSLPANANEHSGLLPRQTTPVLPVPPAQQQNGIPPPPWQ